MRLCIWVFCLWEMIFLKLGLLSPHQSSEKYYLGICVFVFVYLCIFAFENDPPKTGAAPSPPVIWDILFVYLYLCICVFPLKNDPPKTLGLLSPHQSSEKYYLCICVFEYFFLWEMIFLKLGLLSPRQSSEKYYLGICVFAFALGICEFVYFSIFAFEKWSP